MTKGLLDSLKVVLVQRGICDFAAKVQLGQAGPRSAAMGKLEILWIAEC